MQASWSSYTDEKLESIPEVRSRQKNAWRLAAVPLQRRDLVAPSTGRAIALVALAGVVPLAIAVWGQNAPSSYWALALYFSAMWALFFYVAYHTQGADPRIAAVMFLATGIVATGILLALLRFGFEAFRDQWLSSTDTGALFGGYILWVGLVEEFTKALAVFALCYFLASNMPPLRLFLFYGLMSGLGFGIDEGIKYQLGDNLSGILGLPAAVTQEQLTAFYFQDVMRLTSAPFLHAIWTGLVAFFIWLGVRFPSQRIIAFIVALAIPAILHGTYDALTQLGPGWSILVAAVSVAILGLYVGSADAIERGFELMSQPQRPAPTPLKSS